MAKLTGFLPVQALNGVYVARAGGLRCTALILKDNSLCLFSPVAGLNEAAINSLAELGRVTYLLAPNHFHNKALSEYQAAFPRAKLCASHTAKPRLEKVTGLKFQSLKPIANRLPKQLTLVEPAGLKNGEIWVRASTKETRAWLLVDAFAGIKMTAKSDTSAQVSYLKTFPKYGVGNRDEYVGWLAQQLTADKPSLIIPCHGAIMQGKALSKGITTAMKAMFP